MAIHDLNEEPAVEEFLRGLPELPEGATFSFACHPGVPCFNACCADVHLVLGPYDVLRLRRALAVGSSELDEAYTLRDTTPDGGFPCRQLRMVGDAGGRCPFVRPAGCAIYADRPAACRTYPLGRCAQRGASGEVEERLVVVREPHCRGFDDRRAWSGAAWLRAQEVEEYNAWSDRYLATISRWNATHDPLAPRQAQLVDLALFQLDRFRLFAEETELLVRLAIPAALRRALAEDDVACLGFAFDWLDLVLFRDPAKLATWR